MKARFTLTIFLLLLSVQQAWGQSGSITGIVLAGAGEEVLEGATVTVREYGLWAVTDRNGEFSIANVPYGKVEVEVSCLGYETARHEAGVSVVPVRIKLVLKESSLALKEVTVLARRKADDATTTYVIDRTAVEHMQLTSITDVAALLPGGQLNRNATLISSQYFNLRRGMGSEQGSSTSGFGTAVEVDGVRLSNNASMTSFSTGTAYGADVRSVSTSNVESVEIITGVPSVEYGDLSSGVVKVNTRKGRTPFNVEFVLKPHTKQYSIGKGFDMGEKAGTLNFNLERAKSISDLASPYTAYDRNVLSLNYSNVFARDSRSPLWLSAGVTGNVGGYDSSSDPDLYKDTYSKTNANSLRANVGLKWQLNRKWITGLETFMSVNYVNNSSETSSYKNSAGYTTALHGTEQRYYSVGDPEVVLIPSGTWYEVVHTDSRLLAFTARIKGTWVRRFGKVNNRIMAGAEFTAEGNEGRGVYYEDMALAPTWREQRYSDLPYFRTISAYAEDRVAVPFGTTTLHLTAGLRSEWMAAKGSVYGTVNSLSPRFNLKYDIPLAEDGFVRDIAIRAGYGQAVKLPSFSILYPLPSYSDLIVFNPLYAYYTYPVSAAYNPGLRWQREKLHEIGADATIGGVRVSLSYFYNRTIDRYATTTVYTPITYYYTSVPNDTTFPIAAGDRIYSIDSTTGIVTVSDRTGAHADIALPQAAKNIYRGASSRTNASPVTRKGLEWVLDFGEVKSIGTSFRLDGKYYVYKGIDETIYATSFPDLSTGPHPFIGYYVGSTSGAYNGSVARNLNLNLTVATHIPKARLIFTLRLESTLYRMRQNLSEYEGGPFAFVIDSSDSYHPSATQADIYAGNVFVGAYPLYYSTHDDPGTLIPFAESFEWARENDRELYNILATMVKKSNYDYIFNEERISPYYSASIAVTKEIGRIASLTFHASNFFNNTSKVRTTWTDTESTLYGSSYIPSLYYGVSLILKF